MSDKKTDAYQISDSDLEKREILLTPVSTLKIVVHPSFLIDTKESETEKDFILDAVYEKKVVETKEYIKHRFLPTDFTEVTLVMPPEKSSLHSWRTGSRGRGIHWTDLYRTLKKDSSFGGNVMTVEDLTGMGASSRAFTSDKQEVEVKVVKKLESSNFQITSDTEIVLGGEFVDACLYDVSIKLWELPQVGQISFDKKSSISSAYDPRGRTGEHALSEDLEASNTNFINRLRHMGEVTEDEEFVYLKRKR